MGSLSASFEATDFAASALEIAPRMLGAILTVGEVSLRLTEVEAYLGAVDPGSHAFRGPTKRNATMFGPPGHLYAYFTYGMHVCANIVCSPDGEATAVLLRAGEVVAGIDLARARRGARVPDRDLARGPARLTVALGIALADDGAALDSSITAGRLTLRPPDAAVEQSTGPRTGVGGPGGGAAFPWRFWIPGEPTVSPYRAATSRTRSARVSE